MGENLPPLKSIKQILEHIRERADYALARLQSFEEPKSRGWRCTTCGHTKKFTREVLAQTAPPCPKCGGCDFQGA